MKNSLRTLGVKLHVRKVQYMESFKIIKHFIGKRLLSNVLLIS
jgi:hypothetical protein